MTQPLALHAQLPLGQRHHAALGAVPEHRATVATSLLGAGQRQCRPHQHQQLPDQRNNGLQHPLVDARLRPFEQFGHRQQCLAAAGQQSFGLRPVVAMCDLQCGLCNRILTGVCSSMVSGGKLAAVELSWKPPPQVPTMPGTSPVRADRSVTLPCPALPYRAAESCVVGTTVATEATYPGATTAAYKAIAKPSRRELRCLLKIIIRRPEARPLQRR